ncbi:hypothetical protein [Dendronalium sp. ChiSLP03b]|uniref:hypothetical protein n=1 Tax=Dendronalium sp. ChiSLP03b TaxID=3075381 RepID=UPI0039195B9A
MGNFIDALKALCISFSATGNIAATNVQAAIAELDTKAVHTTGNESIAGNKTFSSATASTSTTTGAVVVTGGIGVSGNSYFGTLLATALNVGSSSTKLQISSSDASSLLTANLGRSSGNGNIKLLIGNQNPIGTNENELRLYKDNAEYFTILGARAAGVSGVEEYQLKSYGSSSKIPIRFKLFQNSDSSFIDSLVLNSTGNILIGATEDNVNKLQVSGSIKASQFRLSALNTAPTSATDTGTAGEIRIDANFIYVCTANNTWKRTALTSW